MHITTVTELKALWLSLGGFPETINLRARMSAPTGNKAPMVQQLTKFLQEPTLQQAILKRMQQKPSSVTAAVANASTTSTNTAPMSFQQRPPVAAAAQATAPVARRNSSDSVLHPSATVQTASSTAAIQAVLAGMSASSGTEMPSGLQELLASHFPVHPASSSEYYNRGNADTNGVTAHNFPLGRAPNFQFHRTSSGEANRADTTNNQAEPDPTVTPRPGTREASLLYSVLAMGFTDRAEVLSVVRTCLEGNSQTTADDVMMECLRLREEMEEARKMDAARLESERTRKEESKRRRAIVAKETRQNMLSTPFGQWQAEFFPNSWILQDNTARHTLQVSVELGSSRAVTEQRQGMLDLLEREKNARKWYGPTLPSAWFARVCTPELVEATENDTLMRTIQSHLKALEVGMFSLEGKWYERRLRDV